MRKNSIESLYNRKFDTYKTGGIWGQALGNVEVGGIWLLWGAEKNGKTTGALMLADYLTKFCGVLYVSAEEGVGKNFVDACRRAGLNAKTALKAVDYVPLDELEVELQKRKAAKVVVLDNATIYNDECKYGRLRKLTKDNPDVIFIIIAHEEDKKPFTTTAKMAKRLAKIILHVQGMVIHVSGRCPGGILTIDDEKAALYWGAAINSDKTTEI